MLELLAAFKSKKGEATDGGLFAPILGSHGRLRETERTTSKSDTGFGVTRNRAKSMVSQHAHRPLTRPGRHAGPCPWPAPLISFRRLSHAPRRCWFIGSPCHFPSRSAGTTMRPFRPPLRPSAPTAFSCGTCRNDRFGNTNPPRLRSSLSPNVAACRRAPIIWLRSRRQCRTPCPLRLHIVTALAQL